MPKGEHLGHFEQLVLLAVIRLGDDAYGLGVRGELAERAGRDASIGAVYATLDRLERKGLVRSRRGEPTAARGGRAKKTFRLTTAGESALRETRQAVDALLEGLAPQWGGR